MPDIFHGDEITAVLTELRLAALQVQTTTAAAHELIQNANELVEELKVIVERITKP